MIYSLENALNTAPCGFLSLTDNGNIIAINNTFLQLLEYSCDELIGQKIEIILPIASRIFYQTHFFPLLKLHGKVQEIYFSVRTKSKLDLPMLVNGVRRENAGSYYYDCIFIAITQRIQYEDEILKAKKIAEAATKAQKEAEIALRQQYERALFLKQITQQIHQSLDLPNILAMTAQFIRQCFQVDGVGIFKFLPYSNDKIGEFMAESAVGEFETLRESLGVPLLTTGRLWGLLTVYHCQTRDWQPFEIDILEQIAHQLAIAIQQGDLFEQLQQQLLETQQAEAKLRASHEELSRATLLLEKLARTDSLTQIANRRYFDECLAQEWLRLSREQQPLSVLLFDVDYFKRYNDFYGHQLGDHCLTNIAQASKKAIFRSTDLLARYGGEKFAVILPNTDESGAIKVAERIHQAIHALNIAHAASEVCDRVTISLGIATTVPSASQLPTQLTHQSDLALYSAKQKGRNQSAVFC